MGINFTKMHALGNDFILIDAINQSIDCSILDMRSLANRHTGIGFDQCLVVEKSKDDATDFFYRIFNASGKEVGQCGNGARCLARFVYEKGLTRKKSIRIATATTTMKLIINADDQIKVELVLPKLAPADIPLLMPQEASEYILPVGEEFVSVHALSIGNPHAVMLVPDIQQAPIDFLGEQISKHALFPEETNAGFMEIVDAAHINLRVYERGCGETLACGSGAVAAAAVGRLFYQLAPSITVTLPGGPLQVDWPAVTGPLFLIGPASFVYDGKMY